MIQIFANETLRTLCLCYKDISTEEYESWSRKHKEAQLTIANRDAALDQVYEQIENNLMVGRKQLNALLTCLNILFNLVLPQVEA